jgi:hypothetical protein
MLDVGAREAAENRLGLGSAEAQCGGVLNYFE